MRIEGRVTASQIAAASAASFLPRLPDRRYGVMNFGAITLPVAPPCSANTFLARSIPRVKMAMDSLSNIVMRFRTSHRGTSLPVAAIPRLVRDREVPFMRCASQHSG